MSLWPTSTTPPTPQQLLQAQVAADVQLLASVLASLLNVVEMVAGHVYASSIPNGTPNQTFGPGDYLAALATTPNAPTAVQLLEISAVTIGSGTTPGYLQTLATIQPPPTPLALPTLPPPGVTLTPNPDGATITIVGLTPLQQAQAALIAALATQTTAQQTQTKAYTSRASPTDPNWQAAKTALAEANAAVVSAQNALKAI